MMAVSAEDIWLSVIVPVLDEARFLPPCLAAFAFDSRIQVVVVDGGSKDGSVEIAERFGVETVRTDSPHRAGQLNRGACAAKADVLLFCHADTIVTPPALAALKRRIGDPRWRWGAFHKTYHPSCRLLRWYAWFLNHVHLQCCHRAVGSNAMFIRRHVFDALGGFPDVDFVEDVIMNHRLRPMGPPCLIPEPVVVSSRRYMKNGVLHQIMTNASVWIRLSRVLNRPADLHALRRRYEKDEGKGGRGSG